MANEISRALMRVRAGCSNGFFGQERSRNDEEAVVCAERKDFGAGALSLLWNVRKHQQPRHRHCRGRSD